MAYHFYAIFLSNIDSLFTGDGLQLVYWLFSFLAKILGSDIVDKMCSQTVIRCVSVCISLVQVVLLDVI